MVKKEVKTGMQRPWAPRVTCVPVLPSLWMPGTEDSAWKHPKALGMESRGSAMELVPSRVTGLLSFLSGPSAGNLAPSAGNFNAHSPESREEFFSGFLHVSASGAGAFGETFHKQAAPRQSVFLPLL